MLGKLTWEAVPLHEPIVVVTLAAMVLVVRTANRAR